MEQFSLEKWLENPNCKVVTRDGRPVRIICTDRKGRSGNIVGLVGEDESFIYVWNNDGKHIVSEIPDNDLFFADDKEELTELQKTLEEDCDCYVNLYNDGKTREELREWIRGWCPRILDLARKEIEKDIEESAIEFAKSYMKDVNPSFEKVKESEELWKWKMSCLRGINKAYSQGKQDALKDLPKWKKSDRNWITNICDLATIVRCDGGDHEDYDSVVVSNRVDKDDYYIELGELLKLPKEE